MIARRAFDACGGLVLAENSLTLAIRIQLFVLVGMTFLRTPNWIVMKQSKAHTAGQENGVIGDT